jgi:hypothetical protein
VQAADKFRSETIEHLEATLNGGQESPNAFVQLIMSLLSNTIMDSKSFVCLNQGSSKYDFTIAAPRRKVTCYKDAADGCEVYSSLKLNNGNFLDLHYVLFVDPDDNNYLKTESSRMAYQSDDLGHDQFFRFEMARNPKTHYPFSHLHVRGNWKQGDKPRPKEMEKIHFPIARPTLENLIRVLVYDFEVSTHHPAAVFEPILRECEQRFLKVARTTSKKPQPLPPIE